MATRIYQGRILSAEYCSQNESSYDTPAIDALVETFKLFQDAVNYHLVALAGMADTNDDTIIAEFSRQVKGIWHLPARNKAGARTLQQSISETLNLPSHTSFEEAIQVIYRTTSRRELLPYVLQIILDRLNSGDIQQGSKDLLPKLCDVNFSGNYDYSRKELVAQEGNLRLQQELNRVDISEQELRKLATEMDLSWAGLKTLSNTEKTHSVLHSPEETMAKIKEAMEDLAQVLKSHKDSAFCKIEEDEGINLANFVQNELKNRQPIYSADQCLAKDSPGSIKPTNKNIKLAAIFFMYYPSTISARMLCKKLRPAKKSKDNTLKYELSKLENDPFLLCRAQSDSVYKGSSALPQWQTCDGLMFSRSWDTLAFSEAIKTLHSFEAKTNERRKHVEELKNKLRYIEEGVGKITGEDDENDPPLPVLGGDPRFELLKQLVEEIAPGDYDNYTISHRALQKYEEVLQSWQKAEKQSKCSEETFINIVRSEQGTSERFGSGVLFEALCRKKYQPIWHDWQDTSKQPKPRSQNILRDFNLWQELKQEIEQYERPVNITAADAIESPRHLLFSDLKNFGPKSKGHEFVKGQKNTLRLRVAVRNSAGRLEGATIIVRYSAPRFERDELGTDSACWLPDKKGGNIVTSWLQPMMKALNLDSAQLNMSKEPAVALQVKGLRNKQSSCYLNFPVSFDFAPIHDQIGKAAIWNYQMLGGKVGGKDEKLHLHWPGTYSATQSPWWQSQKLIDSGFTALSIDLGVRYAAAWALINVQTASTLHTAKGTQLNGRPIGYDGNNHWYGFCTKNGLIKIDGEGNGQKSDAAGRPLPAGIGQATPEDEELATQLYNLVGATYDSAPNILILCNRANKIFRRLLSRCRKFQSMLVKLKDESQQEAALREAYDYFSYNEKTKEYIPDILKYLQQKDVAKVKEHLFDAIIDLRKTLPKAAVQLANLVLPRKHGEWIWVHDSKPGYICSGRLIMGNTNKPQRRVFHRGGLSIARLSQIEKLRRNIQSMNRILHTAPGEQADFGASLRNIPVVDPCPDLLRKIENIREQRVNKIAHEIVAQALGVRLLPPRKDKNPDNRDIVHGEYEPIPNRRPVDFVVLENLSRYRTSIDRSPDENSTLMRWAHRQIVAKVQQLLEEVFGIPVICTHAAYTSKFDSQSSAPGFRAVEMTEWRLKDLGEKANEKDQQLYKIYKDLYNQAKDKRDGLKLLMPGRANDGEYFISNTKDGVRMLNADINAAINIGWRGLAAPESLHLLHRVRLNKKKGSITPVYSNKREKALEKSWNFNLVTAAEQSNDFASTFWIAAESDIQPMAQYGSPQSDNTCKLAHGKTLWGRIKAQHWQLCHLFNIRVLQKVGVDVTSLQTYLNKCKLLTEDDSDITI